MENTLQTACHSFLELCKAYYIVEFANKNVIEIRFQKNQFYHLCGLHKLRDLPKFSNGRKGSLIKEMINEKLTTEYISMSRYYDTGIDNVHDRIRSIGLIDSLFTVGRPVVWDFSPSRGNFKSSIHSKIIFFNDSEKYFIIVLGCAKDKDKSYYYPETLFVRTDRQYIDGQIKTNIASVSRLPIS